MKAARPQSSEICHHVSPPSTRPDRDARPGGRFGWIARGLLLLIGCCIATSCSSPKLYTSTSTSTSAGDPNACSVTFVRTKGVIGKSGPSFLLADMGEGVPYNGSIVVNEAIHPVARYKETGRHSPNVAFLGIENTRPEIAGSWVKIAPEGNVTFELNSREFAVRRSLGPASRITIVDILGVPILGRKAHLSDLRFDPTVEKRLLQAAQSAPSGKHLFVLCTPTPGLTPIDLQYAGSLQEAFANASRPVWMIGNTGSGGRLTFSRPPGKMRLVVAAPYVGLAECMDELILEPGKRYEIRFDKSTGSFESSLQP